MSLSSMDLANEFVRVLATTSADDPPVSIAYPALGERLPPSARTAALYDRRPPHPPTTPRPLLAPISPISSRVAAIAHTLAPKDAAAALVEAAAAAPASTAAAIGTMHSSSSSSAASTSASSSSSSTLSPPLRIPLLEEANRLLRLEVESCSKKREAYKAQLYVLEKHKLDAREEVRTLSHELNQVRSTLEDRRFAEREQARDTDARVAEMREEFARVRASLDQTVAELRSNLTQSGQEIETVSRRLADTEDALYASREESASLRRREVDALERDRAWRLEVEAELKKQARTLCAERNTARARADQLSDDLEAARQAADGVAREKRALLEQLYANSKLTRESVSECLNPEAALLALQRTEIDGLTRRLTELESTAQSRISRARESQEEAERGASSALAKVDELREALQKCMDAMDHQREEANEERRTARDELERMKKEHERESAQMKQQLATMMQPPVAQNQQLPAAPPQQQQQLSHLAPAQSPVAPIAALQPPQVQVQVGQVQELQFVAPPAPTPTMHSPPSHHTTFTTADSHIHSPGGASIMSSSSVHSTPNVRFAPATAGVHTASVISATAAPVAPVAYGGSGTFHTLSSHEALAHTQRLASEEAAANERRRLKREERREAIAREEQQMREEEARYASHAMARANGPPPAQVLAPRQMTHPPQQQQSLPPLDFANVPGWSGAPAPLQPPAPIVISAAQPVAPVVISAPSPTPAPLPPSLMPAVTFDFGYMDDMPSFQPQARTATRTNNGHFSTSAAAPSASAYGESRSTLTHANATSAPRHAYEQSDAKMHAALQYALREVEAARLQRSTGVTADDSRPQRQPSPLTSPPRQLDQSHQQWQRRSSLNEQDPAARLAAAMDMLMRGRGGGADGEHGGFDKDASGEAEEFDEDEKYSLASRTSASTRRPLDAAATTKPARPINGAPRRSLATSAAGVANKENVYHPSEAVLAAANPKQEPRTMAPLKRPTTSAAGVPRLALPTSQTVITATTTAPPKRHQRETSDSVSSSRSTVSTGSGKSASNKTTAGLRNIAASLKKNKTTTRPSSAFKP